MPWKVCIFGEWCGPFTLKRIADLTSERPNPFLLAEGVSNADLKKLRKLPRIGGLAILSADITAAAITTLRSLPELREMILCGPPITDEFLGAMEELTQLESITLVHTACTPEGVRRFLSSVRKCLVYKAGVDGVLPASLRRELMLFLDS
jgi:hypothetical protein